MNYKKPQSTIVHGGVGIYPLTTADQVILADGSRLEKDGKINVDSAAESSKLGGKAPEYYIQPRNLLDNSDFTNPVNQRGKTSYTGGYGIDRWKQWSNNHTTNVSNGHITVNVIQQYIGVPINFDTVYTMAARKTDGTILCISGTFNNKINKDGLRLDYDTNKDGSKKPYVCINTAGDYLWAALYEGSYTADTLPPYVPKGYAAEFAECRRYYKRFTSPNDSIICAGYVTSSTKSIHINPMDNYPMRIVKPSCSFSGDITVRGINGYIAQDYRDAVIRVYANATGCISMIEITRGDSAAWNATNNTPLFVTINANSVFELIADL